MVIRLKFQFDLRLPYAKPIMSKPTKCQWMIILSASLDISVDAGIRRDEFAVPWVMNDEFVWGILES